MTVFQELRLWARRAPTGDRISAAIASAVVLALLMWAAIPATGRSANAVNVAAGTNQASIGTSNGLGGQTNPTAATASGPTATGGASSTGPGTGTGTSLGTGVGTGTGTGAATATGTGTGAPAQTGNTKTTTGRSCVSPPGTDQGVTPTQIKIAIVLVDIAGATGNSALGIPPPAVQQNNWQWVVDSVNASGGVACRKLVPEFFSGNGADQSQLQQTCLDIAQAGVFAVLDLGAYTLYPSVQDCFPQHQLPFLLSGFASNAQLSQNYPYFFAGESLDTGDRNTIFALEARGFFSPANGFKKLGFVYGSCFPEMSGEILGWLHQVGLSSSQIVTYDLGCPTPFANPADEQSAILKFEEQGVTNVTIDGMAASFANFTTLAQQQGFHPKYGLTDQGLIFLTYSNTHPDYANIANAVVITGERFGEERTPGYVPSAGTARCNAIFQAHGQPPMYRVNDDGAGGTACDGIWELAAMIDHAPVLHRNALAAGLQAAGSLDLSYPRGPNDFKGTDVTVGDEFWRPTQFFTSCDCWHVTDPTFHPRFS
jgi:hypothetical protein